MNTHTHTQAVSQTFTYYSLFIPIHQITHIQNHTPICFLAVPTQTCMHAQVYTGTVVLHPSHTDACHTYIHLCLHMHLYPIGILHVLVPLLFYPLETTMLLFSLGS